MKAQFAKFFPALGAALLLGHAECTAAPDEFLSQGLAAYRAGQYADAAEHFRSALSQEVAVGTLVNLGLAEWRRGRAGEAVLAWQRAEWLDPFAVEAKSNLRFAFESAQLSPPELDWYETASTWLPAGYWSWLAGGSLCFAVALVILPGCFRRRRAGWQQAGAALGFGLFLVSVPSEIGLVTRASLGVVLEKNTPLRLTPTREAEIVVSLPDGEPARALRTRGNFVLIRTQSGSGWVERAQFETVYPRVR